MKTSGKEKILKKLEKKDASYTGEQNEIYHSIFVKSSASQKIKEWLLVCYNKKITNLEFYI